MRPILGDPGAESGARESRKGRKKRSGRRKVKRFFARSDFPSPHSLPLGLEGCMEPYGERAFLQHKIEGICQLIQNIFFFKTVLFIVIFN